MSYELFGEDVLFFQRLLKAEGLYKKRLDGIWGKYTEHAANRFNKESERIEEKIGTFDRRTERNIQSLTLKAQIEARYFMLRLLDNGIDVKIISGTRTYEQQNKLFRQGRYGNPGKIVTKARGGRSNHNFGIAWDIGIFTTSGGYSTSRKRYLEAAKYGLSNQLEWGGNWPSFPDTHHYQLKTKYPSIKLVRAKFEKGQAYIA